MTRIGVISDTHGLLRPEAVAALRGSDVILHAGDVGRPAVLEELRALAPVYAVRGNVDRGPWAEALPATCVVTIEGVVIHMQHDPAAPVAGLEERGVRGVIVGHTHRPMIEDRGGILYLNPGSAGPRRFSLPIVLAIVELRDGVLHPRLVELMP